VRKSDGTPFKVYSAFYRNWREHGWRRPATSLAESVDWHPGVDGEPIPADPELPSDTVLPDAGEAAALAAWRAYRADGLGSYAGNRNRPDLDRTSHMSVYLKWGCIHPRTMLADLGPDDEIYRKELAWREFYASVVFEWPESARDYYQPQLRAMTYAPTPSAAFEAWSTGRTGYPIVDAGMRQMLGQSWMHNRVRMIVASFLVKDLHIEWQHGARVFMHHLVDGDLASNQHGWQWTAGTGTDPAPYYRIFNPITQGEKFDPNGDYVRRWVPELRGIAGKAVHQPWLLGDDLPAGYPERIVDHAAERKISIERYNAVRG
jgi:deoxyribodipyrimidine photo-lyase